MNMSVLAAVEGIKVADPACVVVVDVYATWCVPCTKLEPFLNSLAGPRVIVHKVKYEDLEDAEDPLVLGVPVSKLPTVLVYQAGKLRAQVVGPNEAAITGHVRALLDAGAGPATPSA
jgi:thiol-disulfide isomerase/thioredoxin